MSRSEVVAALQALNDALDQRVPVTGGTLTGLLIGPPVTEQDPVGTLVTRRYVDDRYLSKVGIQSFLGDLIVSGKVDTGTLKVRTPVKDLLLDPTVSAQGALPLSQAQALFANKNHTHLDVLTDKTGIAKTGGDLDGTVNLSDRASLSGRVSALFGGVSITLAALDSSGNQDAEHALLYDGGRESWVFTGPSTGLSSVLFQTPATQQTEPGLPEHVANKKYVDETASAAAGAVQERGDELRLELRTEMLAEIQALKDEITILKQIKRPK
jgi:hypothetical protein